MSGKPTTPPTPVIHPETFARSQGITVSVAKAIIAHCSSVEEAIKAVVKMKGS
jgi:hypothetical protein